MPSAMRILPLRAILSLGPLALIACGAAPDTSDPAGAQTQATALGGDDNCQGNESCPPGSPDCLLPATVSNLQAFLNPNGAHKTYTTTNGKLDETNPFFQSLGTNGRACVTCHTPEDGFGVSAYHIQQRFNLSCGRDPIFRPNDGANSPNEDVSTLHARRQAYSLLLNKGLIRIERQIPANAEYQLVSVDDPYGNSSANGVISVFRRPLITTNEKFLNLIMWDAREPNLASQATDATLGHAQATSAPTQQQLDAIIAFQTSLFTTQTFGFAVGSTSAEGATGDPVTLSNQSFQFGENPPIIAPVNGVLTAFPTNEQVFTVFNAWANSEWESRQSVARGEQIFNTRQLTIQQPGLGNVTATCTTCHAAFNAGDTPIPVATVLAGMHNGVHVSDPQFRTPDLPLFTFQVIATGATFQTTDPGLALTTGKMSDMNGFKAPDLRGLSAHPPYFHNGSAATIADVVDFYDQIMLMNLSDQEKQDLTNFLQAL
jgi:cytochrome c peroxidase